MITLLAAAMLGCGTAPDLQPPPEVTDPVDTLPYVGGFQDGGFCDVQAAFQVGCIVGCHSGLVPEAGLDLETDPYGAIVGVVGGDSGKILIDPGQPANSWLLQKMEGDLEAADGEIMPPDSAYGELMAPVVDRWIRDGALNDCVPGQTEPPTYDPGERYHPPTWAVAEEHGLAANIQTGGDCRGCHGTGLDGGSSGVSCDSCHDPTWRTDCTFCHGGQDNETGAPPEDMDGETVDISFPAHTQHVFGDRHLQYDCSECHAPRGDVLDPGHVFDDVTAGFGELFYNLGISPVSTYLFGQCGNVYCHGNGRGNNGTGRVGETYDCDSCHPDSTTPNEWVGMSGRHDLHMEQGDIFCSDCHTQTVDEAQAIIAPEYHVNGLKEVVPVGPVWNGVTCSGSCHNHNHNASDWPDNL